MRRCVTVRAASERLRQADLAQYEGQYRSASDPDQVTAVYLDGGALYEESARRERQRLVPMRRRRTGSRLRRRRRMWCFCAMRRVQSPG